MEYTWAPSDDSRPSYSDDDADFRQTSLENIDFNSENMTGAQPLDNDALSHGFYPEQDIPQDDDDSSLPVYTGPQADMSDEEGMTLHNARLNNPDLSFHILEDDEEPTGNMSMEAAEYLSEVVTDVEYSDWIGIRNPGQFPSPKSIKDDLCALVLGTLMAKGENLDCGYDIENFDFQLQEVTGRRVDVQCRYVSLNDLAAFLKLTAEEEKKCKHAKVNLLLHKTFEGIVQYDNNNGHVKMIISPILQELYENVKKTDAGRVKRKQQAEQAKNDLMKNPVNRRRYMISNNLLVELIVKARNKYFETEVGWNFIRDEYREMMEKKGVFYQKYANLLNLEKVLKTCGFELNEQSTRELFGRGTISKALSVPLYRNITMSNDTKRNLLLSLAETDPNQCLYREADFVEIDVEIKKYDNEVHNERREYKISEAKKKKDVTQSRKIQELEERKKVYVPMTLNEVFVPGGFPETTTNDSLQKVKPQSKKSECYLIPTECPSTNAFRISPWGGRRITPETTNETIVAPPSSEENEEPETRSNIFGNGESSAMNLRDMSSIADEISKSAGNFTDEEAEEMLDRHVPNKKNDPATRKIGNAMRQRTSTPIERMANQWETPIQPLQQTLQSVQRRPYHHPVSELKDPQAFLTEQPNIEKSVKEPAQNSIRSPASRRSPPKQLPRINPSDYSFMTVPREQSCIPAHLNSSMSVSQFIQPKLLPSPRIPYKNIFTTHDLLNVTEMQPRELFIQYLTLHVFVHRTVSGASQRFWSQIQKHLPMPLNRPEFIFGPNWIKELPSLSPSIQIVRVGNDLLFVWEGETEDGHFNLSCNFSESSHI